MLSFLPRRWLQIALLRNWRRSLPRQERVLLDVWGATGNASHHEFSWADDIPKSRDKQSPA